MLRYTNKGYYSDIGVDEDGEWCRWEDVKEEMKEMKDKIEKLETSLRSSYTKTTLRNC